MVRNNEDDKIEQRLVKIDRALLRISNLAIHLQTAKEREGTYGLVLLLLCVCRICSSMQCGCLCGCNISFRSHPCLSASIRSTAFAVNKEDHLSPILALEAKKALNGGNDDDDDDEKKKKENSEKDKDGWSEFQEPALLQLLASELNVNVKDIVDFELNLFDIQKASLGGVFSEFVHSARLDNLASCFMAVQALMDHVASGKVDSDSDVSMIVLYDHEEVGSGSAVGAASPIMGEAVRRISAALVDSENDSSSNVSAVNDVYESCLRRSFVLSSDQAHAVHPNYASKHEKSHQPKMNQGMVIKRNANQRYATTTVTGVLIREIARRAGLPPVQEFIVRQDCGCGSTIGPIISAATGIRAIDMGCPQLSMHSIRETMGICDITNGLELFKAFFEHFREVDSSVEQ